MASETYLDLTFERNTKSLTVSVSGGANAGTSANVGNVVSTVGGASGGGSGGGVGAGVGGSEKRPIRPKLLKLSDVTIPHRNRKKTKTKSKDRSVSSVRDRIYDDPAYTDDISHLANPMRRSSVNLVNSDMLAMSSAGLKPNTGGSSSLGKRSKLTKEFQKLAQEDIGHIAFSSSEEDLRYQRASSSRSEAIGRGRSLERSNAVNMGEQNEKLELKRRPEKRSSKQKRNLSLDNKRQQSQQEEKENAEKDRERPPEPPQRLALTRYNLGKQRSDEAAWQRQQSQMDYTATNPDNEDVFSLHSSAKENLSVAASTSASLSNASTSKMQMGKRFLKGEIGIKSFNYYLLKEGLKSSKKFVEKQKSNFQSSTNNSLATMASSAGGGGGVAGGGDGAVNLPLAKSNQHANSEENIYEEIFFKDAPPSEEDDENQNPPPTTNSKHQQQTTANSAAQSNTTNTVEQNIMYADCELCMQQCDKPDCEYCLQPELAGNLNQNRNINQSFNNTTNKSNNANNRLNTGSLNNNSSSRTAMENQVNSAPILEFQSYNPNNPGVYKIETTPVAITGDYNPILQFQQPSSQQHLPQHHQQQHKHTHVQHQSTSTTSTATTTPSDHHLHQHISHHQQQPQQQLPSNQQHQTLPQQSHHQQQQQQQQQQFYGYKQPNFYAPHAQTGFWSQTSSVPRPRAYMVAGHFPSGVSSMQRMNTKSSSSSDSLQQQHKFNTFTHMDANFYNGSNLATITGSSSVNNSYLPPQPLAPLMYAASRRLGGSQILVDNSNNMFENQPQIYKSDSRASILSEYSLSRSSDTYYGGQRYGHNRLYGTTHGSDQHNFENSLMSSYATAAQRRYFGSAESCRFGYDCRRCSLDSGPGAGLLANTRASGGAQNNGGPVGSGDKCTFSDHCKYDCRNCDCSSVYFSSDFDDVYSGGGIPRKTAKGTLPSTGGQPPPGLDSYDVTTNAEKQQALKQNKYAQDFFKHVNDVKRSIYQAEMQRNGNMESMSPKKSMKKEQREKEREILGITTLPLAKERTTKPTPAPRTSLQQQLTAAQSTPQPLQRRLPAKSNDMGVERKEYASLDRLIASNKGAIPKNSMAIGSKISPHSSPKSRNQQREPNESKTNEQYLTLDSSNVNAEEKRHSKKHSKESSKITSSSLAASLSGHRRKDIPAPPPPSPATYADLQELQQNMQDTMRDDTKQERDRKRKRKQHENSEHEKQHEQHQMQQDLATNTITKEEAEEKEKSLTDVTTKENKTKEQQNIVESKPTTTKAFTDNTNETTNNTTTTAAAVITESKTTTTTTTEAKKRLPEMETSSSSQPSKSKEDISLNKSNREKVDTTDEAGTQPPSNSSMTLVSVTSVSSSIVTALDSQQRDQQTDAYDDDVFYDARSEDSACTAASSSMASNAQMKPGEQQKQQEQQAQQTSTETKCQQSEKIEQKQQQGLEECKEKYSKNLTQKQQDINNENLQQEPQNLEAEGQLENEQQPPTLPPTTECHKVNEPLQQQQLTEQQMNKNEIKKKMTTNNNREDNEVITTKLQLNDNTTAAAIDNNSIASITAAATAATNKATAATTTTTTTTNSGVNVMIGDPVMELKVNKHSKKKQEINENMNKNELDKLQINNDELNAITKDNDKINKSDKRETKRVSKHKRDYMAEEERRENRIRNQQQQQLQQQQQQHDDEKPNTTVITTKNSTTGAATASLTKKQRTQRRSPSSNYGGSGGAIQASSSSFVAGAQKVTTSTLSCDTCCQLEWSQHDLYINSPTQHQQQQQQQQQQTQHSPQTLKPPTLHIGMAGQPTRAGKRKNSSSSAGNTSRERATKTKQEIKTKIIYSQETTTESSTTTTTIKTSRETGISTMTTVTKINKTNKQETDIESKTTTETCSALLKSTNVAETKALDFKQQNKEDSTKQNNKLKQKEKLQENPDILKEFKEISKAIANLQHDAETSILEVKENDRTKENVKELVEQTTTKALLPTETETNVKETLVTEEKLVNKTKQHVAETQEMDNDTNVYEKAISNVEVAEAAATDNDNNECLGKQVFINDDVRDVYVRDNVANENDDNDVEEDDAAADNDDDDDEYDAVHATAAVVSANVLTPPTTTVTAIDSKTNTTNISCNSEFAGVTTHSPLNSSSPVVPSLITTLQSSLSQESDNRRPPLQRQDYSCLDSSEAQSDDSHLTRDSITRESQNDELSSSTLDKIDVSTLPLPALPPKKRRTKLRASPSKHHHCRSRHESPQKQQQQELRDPHGPNDNQPLNAEDNKHLSAFQQYVAKRRESLEASTRSFNEKLESRRMHYHMGGGGGAGSTGSASASGVSGIHMPTYLFGEQYYTGLSTTPSRKSMGPSSKEEIYLNKSGWVQVNTKRGNDENRGYRRANYNHQNGDLRNTIRVIQIDNTRRSDMARQALLQHQHSMMEPPKFVSSKVEELIQRNEARLGNANGRDSALRPGYRIVDPQLASILNERPGFLPVKNLNDHDSPPPITPILSPPPAFQDSSAKIKSFDRRRTISSRPTNAPQHTVLQPQAIINNANLQASNGGHNKGMVFSRSFEYDNRRPTPTDAYVETFSRSFDGNLTERVAAPLPRDRSPNFSTLTGNSPNYLTKKDSGGGSSGSLKSRDSSPKYQSPVASISSAQSPQNQKTTAYLNTSVKEAPPSYSVAGHAASMTAQKYSPRSTHHDRSFERSKSHNVLGRSRKSQFSRSGSGSTAVMANSMGVSRFRSFDTTASQRLNSCDSGARSDLSNDELDIEEDDAGSSEFLNTNSYHPATSPFKSQRQRSLTPDRNESHSSSSSLRKQRSITPESRSLTPEDRRKKGSQVSLSGSRQNSSSRSNTLERKHEKVNISRSSSSSSYSGREHDNHASGVGGGILESAGMRVGVVGGMGVVSNQHRRSLGRNAKQSEEHRIRRSRSLQLTERSPNRGHKMVVCVGQNHTASNNQPPLYQQSNMRNNLSNMPTNNFPPTIRTSGKSQSILINNTNGGVGVPVGVTSSSSRHRQNDIDKSRSFDFDYCNYNSPGNNIKTQHSNNSLSQNLLNREAAMRLEFDKSRSFDEDYREVAVVSNNNLNANAMRYLQANENSERNHVTRIRRTSPVEGNGRNTRSPQSSGSSCNNLSVPRSTTSPQNYGTRLCDHEMTYDLMRKSLDRSPIMDFRRGDSAGGGDYDIPISMLRNRETINSGGNSELNFMNSDNRQYEQHLTSNSLKQQRSLRRTHSPNETHYSLERNTHNLGSRDDIAASETNEYRNEYNDIYRRTRSNNRGSDLFKINTTNLPLNNKTTTNNTITTTSQTTQTKQPLKENCEKSETCTYWPQCGNCQNSPQQQLNYEYLKSLPIKRKNLQNIPQIKEEMEPLAKDIKSLIQQTGNISSVKININTDTTNEESLQQKFTKHPITTLQTRLPKSCTQWTLLCKNAMASTTLPSMAKINLDSNTVVNVKSVKTATSPTSTTLVTSKLTETTEPVTTTANTTTNEVTVTSSNHTSLILTPSASSPAILTLLTTNSTETEAAATEATTLPPTTTTVKTIQQHQTQQQPRVIPLAPTSSVFLGDFEMPITREHSSNTYYNKFNDIYETTAKTTLSSSSTTAIAADGSESTSKTEVNNIENNVTYYEAKIHDNLKRLYTNSYDNANRKYHTNKYKNKNSKIMTMRKILENDSNESSGSNSISSNSSCNSSNSSGSCNESIITSSSCVSSNNNFNLNYKAATTANSNNVAISNYRKKKNLKMKAGKIQRYGRRPRLSLPNIWLNLAEHEKELQSEGEEQCQQKRYTRTATTNDGISVIGIRNGFPTNLSHQIRAVSSPSLTSETTTATNAATAANPIHQRVPSSNSSYTTTSHEDCQTNTTNNNNTAANSHSNSNTSSSNNNSQNVGVLQKFKRTLTNFNKHQATATNHSTSSTTATVGTPALGSETTTFLMADSEMQTDVTDGCSTAAGAGGGSGVVSNKYRFGPLVWRTSKERRKTKYNRRDKCNSGDSGIQIELENDEQFARVLSAGNGSGVGGVASLHMSNGNGSLFNRKQESNNSLRVRAVRRTNSAKVSSIIDENTCSSLQSHKSHLLKHIDLHNEREAPESLPTRSLSQPNGLESCGMTRNDLDDSDSDSVTSHEEASSYYPIYAEVLYNFTAAGPQELGLEKGTLIEILRKEIGPWWFGRIKKEDASLVEEILDPELGWFPKEFVRVIHSPETDYFYLQHMADLQQHHEEHVQQQQLQQQVITETLQTNLVSNENHLLNTSTSVPCALLVNTSNSSLEDNCNNTTVIDQHNVTTIVIESSSSTATLPPAPLSSPTNHFNNLENQVANDATTATNNSTNLTANTTTTTSSQQSTILSTSQSLNVIMDSADILRRSAVKELLDTEVNYVKLLAAICEGYLPAMSKRIDIFSPNSIRLIFSNITAIYKFQRKFLEALRKGIEQNQVAKVFLKMHKGFLCYSTYCNSYPRALIELASYERVKDARTILDNCRETENLAELPLSAHLLAPVQRICRYPLHLGEMIKSSEKGSEPPAFSLAEFEQIDVSQLNIPDTTETIDMALEAMKSVTEAVNEGKRHSETIARHQASFQNFKGPPLHLHSTRFFVQIDATRQKQNLWNSSCTLFLFDNQLVYCKRDIIKRSNFIYKGRIFLDRCRVVNVRDGKMFGHTIKNSLRIYCEARDKWFDFSFRSANRKHRFLNTLALERQFGGKSLYISEMTGFEYAFEERDYSDQSDYEAGDSGEQKLKEFLYETNLNTGNNTNTSGESSVPESPAKAFKYSDTLPHKKTQRLDTTMGHQGNDQNQTGSLGRRRLGNWFRKPKSTASTPNQSPTHKGTQGAHSTGDLQLTGTDLTESYNVIETNENNGGVSS